MMFKTHDLKSLLALIVLTGCTTSSDTGSNISSTIQVGSNDHLIQLDAVQIRSQFIGNTVSGKTDHFKRAGVIEYWIYYAPDGTAKDRIRIPRRGLLDRSIGAWRVIEGENLFCAKFAKRREGREVCSRIYVSNDQFRTEPLDPNEPKLTGRIIPGDQVQ